ncbi:EAL domain-containing protein [Magnetospirillum sulfuroxidans]|uniref:EAL domain-containing protein n=1 Tax=Magnetospirillum sulfuroxidans TaxID=611300 RepID=A0ABS5I9N1_9PROT|nr:EAL domain-containing protein [Magnetospirillum sulfuroxidans]MBR9971029.1 EAL domain-containing protein [Magnetospirillum sulfuroxidans]
MRWFVRACAAAVLAVFLGWGPLQAQSQNDEDGARQSITVVIDDNYPPYIFRDQAGQLQGILKDVWALWSERTGIAVDLQGMDWGQAQRRMAEGKADVIDTLFRTEAREKTLSFSAPHATIDVSIFFHRDLSGIVDANSLRGFTVGVKAGDACIDWLKGRGITSIRPYPSYDAVVEALAARETLVACIDRPPALYLMYKTGVQDVLRQTQTLYSGQFHWAVSKDRPALLALVRQGFEQISPRERAVIEERWFGSSVNGRLQAEIWRSLGMYVLGGSALALVLLGWNWLLRRQVARKTASLTQAMNELAESEGRFRTIFDNVNDAIFIHEVESGRLLMVNRRMREMYRVGDVAVESIPLERISEGRPPYGQTEAEGWMRAATAGMPQQFEWLARSWDGELFWAEVAIRRASLSDGQDRLLVVVRDISERKVAQARLEFLAHHDPLTELPNRLLLQDRVEQAITLAERENRRMALLFIDLDQFKTVNDSLGHAAGDRLLKDVAKRLRQCVRESDTIARLGGDEFIIVLNNPRDADAVVEVAEKIQKVMTAPLFIDDQDINSSLSMGIALYPDDGDDFDTLLKKADTAMYHAKQSGRSTYRFFAARMNVEAVAHLALRSGLHRALERGEFELHYQPQVSLNGGTLIGAEALIRWNHPERGLVLPGEFIPVAEDSGLIVPMGDWVLREACRQAALWQAQGHKLTMAVNLSALQFRRGDLEKAVGEALAESGLDPAALELELTESIMIQDHEAVMDMARRLGRMGVQLSIDDFGTGYSSMAYLKRFAVDKLKIDQSFIRDVHTDNDSAAITRAIIQMAHSLNLTVIAEGVEDEAAGIFLRDHGCDQAQGYLYGRPMTALRFEKTILDGAISSDA